MVNAPLSRLIFILTLMGVSTFASAQGQSGSNVYDIGVYVTNLERTKDFYTSVFGLKVVREWDSMDISFDDENYQTVPLAGLYLVGDNGMHLEFLQRADPDARQEVQEPINHFAIEVADVKATYDLAISKGAKPAFSDERVQYAKIGDFRVTHTQIIGLDGERIQILRVLE
ncbi:MAG: VOC family protein [Halioglobus sp.]